MLAWNDNRLLGCRRAFRAVSWMILGLLLFLPGCAGNPWPTSSEHSVAPLGPRSLDSRSAAAPGFPDAFRFAAFGDQRALADGEWQELLGRIHDLSRTDPGLLFMIDTGDIVGDGSHSDQFRMLDDILSAAGELPYWVAVGNHEVKNNSSPDARENAADFLSYLDDGFSVDRMYYEKRVGAVRFLFLDTNDLVYGPDGDGNVEPVPGSRVEAQLEWLEARLADPEAVRFTVVSLHHPLVQSSSKHRPQAAALWNTTFRGRSLPDILVDGGVDLVLTGHTHTYETFRVTRSDGRGFVQVNISGRPRNAFLWIGAGSRRARDIRDQGTAWFEENGWGDLSGWTLVQEQVMTKDAEADQFCLFSVSGEELRFEARFLDPDSPGGTRAGAEVVVR